MKKSLKILLWILAILAGIGGLNWLLVGLFSFDLLTKLFGSGNLTKFLYGAAGVATIWVLIWLMKKKR